MPPAMRRPGAHMNDCWNAPIIGESSPTITPPMSSRSMAKDDSSCIFGATTILAIEASGPGTRPWLSAVSVR